MRISTLVGLTKVGSLLPNHGMHKRLETLAANREREGERGKKEFAAAVLHY